MRFPSLIAVSASRVRGVALAPDTVFSKNMNAAGEIQNALRDLSASTDLKTAELLVSSIVRNATKLARSSRSGKTLLLLSADLSALVKSEKQFQQLENRPAR